MKKGIDTWPDPAPDLTELHEMSLEIVLVSSKAGSWVGFVCRQTFSLTSGAAVVCCLVLDFLFHSERV